MSREAIPYVITIDVGTSSTRAILYDAEGAVVDGCIAQRTTRAETSADGGAVFHAEELFGTIVEVVDQVLASAGPRAERIGAVAMDTLVGNVLGVDGEGRPLTPAFTYADTRNAADAQALRRELGPDGMADAHDRTGCLIHSAYLPAAVSLAATHAAPTARGRGALGERGRIRLLPALREVERQLQRRLLVRHAEPARADVGCRLAGDAAGE